MLTNLISAYFEAAVIQGVTRGLARMGFTSKPDPDAALADFHALTGQATAVPTVVAVPIEAPAIEAKPANGRRGKKDEA